MTNNLVRIPAWFWVVSIVALLWNLMGVGSFFQHLFISPEELNLLPQNEQELYTRFPMWTKIAFALAVFGGFLGCVALLLRKKWSVILFQISLIGVLVQMFHSLFITKATEVYGPGAVIMPIMVILVAFGLVWFSRVAVKKGWLR
ncbi:MAG: hypothetical protein AAFU57_05995 [Bacteroidota bacterium]